MHVFRCLVSRILQLFVGAMLMFQVNCGEDMRRSSNGLWITRSSNVARIRIETPEDLCGIVDSPSLGFSVHLHTVNPPVGVIDDKNCLVEIGVERMRKDRFRQKLKSESVDVGNNPNRAYWLWSLEQHSSISKFENRRFMFYRYDADCKNGDVISTRASVTRVYKGDVSIYDNEDEAIVRRVLGSVRCLEEVR
jgi:hypothetical protein